VLVIEVGHRCRRDVCLCDRARRVDEDVGAGGSAVDVRDQRGTVLSLDKVEGQAVGGAAGPSDQSDGVGDRVRTPTDDDDGGTGDGERLSDRPADPLTTARHERELAYEHGHGRTDSSGRGTTKRPPHSRM
jgi:hypothetical protein